MDSVTLSSIATNCCPSLYLKFAGVASADTFLSQETLTKMKDCAGDSSFFYSYQIVNNAAQTQRGQHWLLVNIFLVQNIKEKQ